MRANRKLLGALAVGGLVIAAGSAFTASNTFNNTNTTVGYGAQNVTGATVTAMTYGLSADGTTVTSVTLVTQGDTSGSSAAVGFTVSGTPGATSACGAGVYTTGTPGFTTYTCSGLTQSVAGIDATDVVVS